jgi:gag-polypeptide of LTR copia-type
MGYLEGTIQRPTTPSPSTDPSHIPLPVTPTVYWGLKSPSQDEWEQRNAYAQGLITLNVKNPIGHGVNLTGTAADSWKSLTDIQDKVTDIGRLAAGNSLRSIRHIEGNNLDTHFCSLQKAWKRYNDQGGRMDDTKFWMVILASMLREWMVFISTLGAYTTLTEVIAQIMAHDSMLAHDRPAQGTPAVVKALATAHQNQQSQLICTNPVCGRIRHTIDKCFKPGGGMEGQCPDWWRKKGTSNNSNTQKLKPTVNVTMTDSTVAATSGSSKFYALVTNTNPSQANTPQYQVVTFADSACSDHCFINKSDFITYKPFHDKDGDTAAKGGKFKISGTGQVEKHVVFDR